MPALSTGLTVTQGDVELAVLENLKLWLPHYLADIDEEKGLERGTTRVPRSWDVGSELERFPEQAPPALIVVAPGIVKSERHGADAWRTGTFDVRVIVLAGGATLKGTRDLADRHAAAVMKLLEQQADQGGLAQDTWLSADNPLSTRVITNRKRRRLAAFEVRALVQIQRVFKTRGLIPRTVPTPPTDPAEPTPTPHGTVIHVNRT